MSVSPVSQKQTDMTESKKVYKQILVPLDGSELAEKAIPYAARICEKSKGAITLFAVSGPGKEAEGRLLNSYLQGEARELAHSGIKVSTIVQYGDAADEILNFAEESGTNLIVISAHGQTGPSRWLTGSVSTKVIAESYTPLLLIKTGATPTPPDAGETWKMMVALDGSQIAEKILPCVCDLAKSADSEVILFSVNESIDLVRYGMSGQISDWETNCRKMMAGTTEVIQQYLQKVEIELKSKGVNAISEIALGNAAEEIIAYAESNDISIIAMTAQGQSGRSKWPFGSVANKVVHSSSRSTLLLLRPQPRIISTCA